MTSLQNESSKDLELVHYGVKGMRWGVSRKSDESSTPKQTLKDQSNSLGSNDRTLKKGSEILYVSDRKYKAGKTDRIYSSYTKSDKNTYTDLIGSLGDSGKVYQNTFKVKSDLKIPSDRKAAELFSDMVKENPKLVAKDMAKAYKARVGIPLRTEKHFEKKISELSTDNKKVDDLYRKYNKSLVVDMESSSNFYSRLTKEGYGALSDLNDRGRTSQDPLIVFSPGKKLSEANSVSLSKKDIDSYMDYAMTRQYKRGQKDFTDVQR